MPLLTRIAIYPLKSFDPILVDQARVLANGALEHDRRFAFVDATGKFVNAKRTALIHQLQVVLDPLTRTLSARRRSESVPQQWQIDSERASVEAWFSEFFSMDVKLIENDMGGFPNDDVATGPTLVSNSTLQSVAGWFRGVTLDEARLRFRTNLEIDAEQFWEDRLYGATADTVRQFRIGDVTFVGTNPCQRCVVPSRDPTTGIGSPEFAKQFALLRESQLPAWASRARFDHFYRLTINTRLIDLGNEIIRVGAMVQLCADTRKSSTSD